MNTPTKSILAQRTMLRPATLGAALCMAWSLSAPAQAADGEGWDWMVAPYGWAASIGADLHRDVPPAGGISTDNGFDDILDKIDGAFQVHAEGQNDEWGMFGDFTYLGLADEQDRARFHTESDLDTRLFELAAVWSPGEGTYRGLDVFAGLRYIDVDMTVKFTPNNPQFNTTTFDGSETYNDFMIGARYSWALSDHWGLTVRGDSSFGDTEGSWNASAVASYKTNSGAWLFGYRYLNVELETGNTSTDITLNGPMVGYAFKF